MSRKLTKILSFVLVITGVLAITSIAFSLNERAKREELYQNMDLYSDVFAIIQRDYVDEIEVKDLVYGSLKGMLSSLDPHSQFLDPDTYNELKVDTSGEFGGLGIEITIRDGLLTIVTPLEDTPAWEAGIKAGDYIVKINDELTRDITLIEAVKKMRGKPGTGIDLTVWRIGEDKLLDFKIVRQIIKIKDIKDVMLIEDGIAYIRLVEFRQNTPRDFNKAVKKLKAKGANSLILDLRNNPGGLLDVAVDITASFIKNGKLIVYTQGRMGSQDLKLVSSNKKADEDLALVVLINEGSASGSEIVAAALQDHQRAIVLGTKSFGKGSVQTVIPLSDGSAVRLTTSKYFTPSGRVIHGEGVIPDIVVEAVKLELLEEEDAGDSSKAIFDKIEKQMDKQKAEKEIAEKFRTDNQLMHALDVLKAIKVYRKIGSPFKAISQDQS